MDSMLDMQVVRWSCAHCAGEIQVRIAAWQEAEPPGCSACEADILVYVDQLRGEADRLEALLAARGRILDQALTENWREIQQAGQQDVLPGRVGGAG